MVARWHLARATSSISINWFSFECRKVIGCALLRHRIGQRYQYSQEIITQFFCGYYSRVAPTAKATLSNLRETQWRERHGICFDFVS